jgi:Icc-related predicted phosphoesterase
MKILAVADKRHRALYDYFDRERWRDIDLVLSCGDLDAGYLSFLVTVLPVPLLFVPGNHDLTYEKKPPEGCDSIDDRVVSVKGAVVGGLGGSFWYNGKDLQYTETQMARRVRRLSRKVKKIGRIDILVTHAPPSGIHDQEDMCHTGFRAFLDLIDTLHPQVLVHGHTHEVYGKKDRDTTFNGTRIINAFGYYSFEFDVPVPGPG